MKVLVLTTAGSLAHYITCLADFHDVFHVRYEPGDFLFHAKEWGPDVILVIASPAIDHTETKPLRDIAPSIYILTDSPHPRDETLIQVKRDQAYDKIVALDGIQTRGVDFATLTPVSRHWYEATPEKDIRFGFCGNPQSEQVLARWIPSGWRDHPRWVVIREAGGALTWRKPPETEDSGDMTIYADFMLRTKIALNTAWQGNTLSGSQKFPQHVKGRIIEAAWARCVLLENAGSPLKNWFPSDSYLTYEDGHEAARIARKLPDDVIGCLADRLRVHAFKYYRPEQIYQQIFETVGL